MAQARLFGGFLHPNEVKLSRLLIKGERQVQKIKLREEALPGNGVNVWGTALGFTDQKRQDSRLTVELQGKDFSWSGIASKRPVTDDLVVLRRNHLWPLLLLVESQASKGAALLFDLVRGRNSAVILDSRDGSLTHRGNVGHNLRIAREPGACLSLGLRRGLCSREKRKPLCTLSEIRDTQAGLSSSSNFDAATLSRVYDSCALENG